MLAEALSLGCAMVVAFRHDFTQLYAEIDNTIVAQALEERYDLIILDYMLKDCKSFSQYFNFFSLTHIKRDGNMAHHIAKSSCVSFICMSDFPFDIVKLVNVDLEKSNKIS